MNPLGWTIGLAWFAMLCCLLSMLIRIFSAGNRSRFKWARGLWTVGFVLFCLHVLTAFHFVHHWSHAEAYAATARRTAVTIGVSWGGGVYFNHLFMLIWGIDVAWWWTGLQCYETRSSWMNWLVLGFMTFIIFNATVVFAQTSLWWCGLAASLLIAISLSWRLLKQKVEAEG